MLDPRRLEALVAVHRTGSVSAAAEELHYGQPTVSHHLRRLEAETRSVLVQRVGRGVRLTPDGERLARRGAEILGLLGRAEAELAAATSLLAGRVRLAAFPSAAATLVPAALEQMTASAPGLAVELVEAEPPEAATMLLDGAVDVALTFDYSEPESSPLTLEPLLADPLHLVTATGSGITDIAGAADARWVTGCERCRAELVELCARAGFAPQVGFASDDYVAVQAMVATGFGVTVLPGLALRAHRHPGVTSHRLEAGRRVCVATYGLPPRPASVEAVIAALRRTQGGLEKA